jgi:hypothetical protein
LIKISCNFLKIIFSILINSNSTPTRKPETDKSRLEPNNAQSLSTPTSPTGSRISSPNLESKTGRAIVNSKALNPEMALSEYNKNRTSGKPLINLVVVIVINLFVHNILYIFMTKSNI